MSTIAENLTAINNCKQDIKEAIIDRDGNLTDSSPLVDYADAIIDLPNKTRKTWRVVFTDIKGNCLQESYVNDYDLVSDEDKAAKLQELIDSGELNTTGYDFRTISSTYPVLYNIICDYFDIQSSLYASLLTLGANNYSDDGYRETTNGSRFAVVRPGVSITDSTTISIINNLRVAYEFGCYITFPNSKFNDVDNIPYLDRYTFIQWNQRYLIANNANYVNDGMFKTIVIGPEYDLTQVQEDTEITVKVNATLAKTYGIRIQATIANDVTVYWGDGSTTLITATTAAAATHKYTTTGIYKIIIHANSGTYKLLGSSGTDAASALQYFGFGIKDIIIGTKCTELSYFCIFKYGLEYIEIPNSLTNIGTSFLRAARNLDYIVIPRSIKAIGSYFCTEQSGIKAIVIPSTITPTNMLGSNAFQKLYSLKYFSCPKMTTACNYTDYISLAYCIKAISSTFISKYAAFYDTQYTYDRPNENIQSFIHANSVQNYATDEIVESTVSRFNQYLYNLTIPSTTSTLPYYSAFAFCDRLKTVTITSDLVPRYRAFIGCTSLTTVNGSEHLQVTSSLNMGFAFAGCKYLESFNIGDNVLQATELAQYMFLGCNGLENVTISETGNVRLHTYMFDGCYSLKDLSFLPSTLTALGTACLAHCFAIKKYEMPDTITAMAGNVFWGDIGLKYFKWNDTIDYIQGNTFNGCSALETLNFGNTRTTIPGFGSATSHTASGDNTYVPTGNILQFVVIPDNLYSIWANATTTATWKSYTTRMIKYSDYTEKISDVEELMETRSYILTDANNGESDEFGSQYKILYRDTTNDAEFAAITGTYAGYNYGWATPAAIEDEDSVYYIRTTSETPSIGDTVLISNDNTTAKIIFVHIVD